MASTNMDNGTRAMKILAWIGGIVGAALIAGLSAWMSTVARNSEAIIKLQETQNLYAERQSHQTEMTNAALNAVNKSLSELRADFRTLALDGVLRKNFEDWIKTFRQLNQTLVVPDLPR